MSNIYIIILFVIAASVGAYLYSFVLRDKKRPILIVALHGIIAFSTFGLLTFNVGHQVREYQLFIYDYPLEALAFVFFGLAATGGVYMFFRDKFLKKDIKKWMPLIHGGLAVTGLIILIIAAVLNT